MRTPKYFFITIDLGFILFWTITAIGIIPAEYLYKDNKNEILAHWNLSFFPLDIAISFTGLTTLYLFSKNDSLWKILALILLILSSVSGLHAITNRTLARDFDLSWWIPNLFLLIYPLFFIPRIFRLLAGTERH